MAAAMGVHCGGMPHRPRKLSMMTGAIPKKTAHTPALCMLARSAGRSGRVDLKDRYEQQH